MSGYFDDDEFDEAALAAVLEAPPARPPPPQQTTLHSYFTAPATDPVAARQSLAVFNRGLKTPLVDDITILSQLLYPADRDKRDYQVRCVEAAARANTLVVLPTGLGKTFIASVLLSNLLRWFPTGKCVFMAPTRQLVLQQAKACSEMAPLPVDSMAVLLDLPPSQRPAVWARHRLLFCTPQIVDNDFCNNRCPLDEIVGFVFDEAHHSKGNAAMAGIVARRQVRGGPFRVLALSATPGAGKAQIQTVVDNLLIEKIIAYDRHHPLVKGYVNERQEDRAVLAISPEIQKILNIFDPICSGPAKILRDNGLLYAQLGDLAPTFFRGDHFARRLRDRSLEKNWAVMNAKTALQALVAARHHLVNCALRLFVAQLQHDFFGATPPTHPALAKLARLPDLAAALSLAQSYVSEGVLHPKLHGLRQLLIDHFAQQRDSRAIVFVEYKLTADVVVACIGDCAGVIPIRFVGQQKSTGAGDSAGMRPKEQAQALEKFCAGRANVLVATCIGEEGLDIGEVDLVVEYGVASTALRSTQRRGRTARRRRGRCVSLLMEGAECSNYEQNLKAMASSFRLLQSGQIRVSGVPGRLRPPHLPFQISFDPRPNIRPWQPPLPPPKPPSAHQVLGLPHGENIEKVSKTPKSASSVILLEGRCDFDELCILNDEELGGIRPLVLLEKAEQIREPIQRLTRSSRSSRIFVQIMNLAAKLRLDPLDDELEPIAERIPASIADRTAVSATHALAMPPPPASDSDAELHELLHEIELFSQPTALQPRPSPRPSIPSAPPDLPPISSPPSPSNDGAEPRSDSPPIEADRLVATTMSSGLGGRERPAAPAARKPRKKPRFGRPTLTNSAGTIAAFFTRSAEQRPGPESPPPWMAPDAARAFILARLSDRFRPPPSTLCGSFRLPTPSASAALSDFMLPMAAKYAKRQAILSNFLSPVDGCRSASPPGMPPRTPRSRPPPPSSVSFQQPSQAPSSATPVKRRKRLLLRPAKPRFRSPIALKRLKRAMALVSPEVSEMDSGDEKESAGVPKRLRSFIDFEAEHSGSEEEEEEEDGDLDSFVCNTPDGSIGSDDRAFYRQSLLSQAVFTQSQQPGPSNSSPPP